ncbi:hypothetical protein JZ785_25385 [Alicyclobacillus curvatus]|nr:hypothetical protein JZ785_25385 [Alicyclobacillus curvatus]
MNESIAKNLVEQYVAGWKEAGIETVLSTLRDDWHGNESYLEGATIVRFRGEKIQSLREYATTAKVYEWNGTWKE